MSRIDKARELVRLARQLLAEPDDIFGDDAPKVDPSKVQKLKDETKDLQEKNKKLKNQDDWRQKSPIKMSEAERTADAALLNLAKSLYRSVLGRAGHEVSKAIQEALKQAYELGQQGRTAKTAGPTKKMEVVIRRTSGRNERGKFTVEFKVQEGPGKYRTVRTEQLKAEMTGFGPGQSAWSKVKAEARSIAESMMDQYGCTEIDIH